MVSKERTGDFEKDTVLTLSMAFRLSALSVTDNCTEATFTGINCTTSDSTTSLGTVFIMRSRRSRHVFANAEGEDMLRTSRIQHNLPLDRYLSPHLCIVALLSLLKIRRSDKTVVFAATTSGFCDVPSRYSVTLRRNTLCSDRKNTPITQTTHTELSNAGVGSNVSISREPSAGTGTIPGKSGERTPPSVCPHATSPIISDGVKPCLRKISVCVARSWSGAGTPKGPSTTASTRPMRKGMLGPPHSATARTVPTPMMSDSSSRRAAGQRIRLRESAGYAEAGHALVMYFPGKSTKSNWVLLMPLPTFYGKV
jgi:hypothetical protein